MTRDAKEERLKDIRQRFRRVRARHEFVDALRRAARNPAVWVTGLLLLVVLCLLAYAF